MSNRTASVIALVSLVLSITAITLSVWRGRSTLDVVPGQFTIPTAADIVSVRAMLFRSEGVPTLYTDSERNALDEFVIPSDCVDTIMHWLEPATYTRETGAVALVIGFLVERDGGRGYE